MRSPCENGAFKTSPERKGGVLMENRSNQNQNEREQNQQNNQKEQRSQNQKENRK